MLNKKLIAGSIFALMSAPALAVPSFSAYTTKAVSQEGSATLTSVTVPVVTVTSGAEYSDDDLIVIDYNVPLATGFTPASTLTMYASCTTGTTGGGPAVAAQTGTSTENGGELTLGLLSSNAAAGSITYRITDVSYARKSAEADASKATKVQCKTSNNTSVGAVVALEAVNLDAQAARSAGAVTGTYHATLPNGTTDIDGGSIGMTHGTGVGLVSSLIGYTAQWTDVVTTNVPLSGTIDVTNAAPRSVFTGPTAAATGTATLAKVAALHSPTIDVSLTFTLNGDFSFLVDESATTAGIQNDAFKANITGGAAAASSTITATSMSWTFAAADASVKNVVVTFDNTRNGNTVVGGNAVGGKLAMAEGSFTYDVSIAYKDGGKTGTSSATDGVAGTSALTSGGALGKWILNGSSDKIKNYPLSSAVTQFVWVTNTGTQDGKIFATAIGGTGAQVMTTCDLGVDSKAGEIIRITDELNTCLTAAGMTSGRAEVTITVNADDNLIDVYGGYKHNADADRLNLTM